MRAAGFIPAVCTPALCRIWTHIPLGSHVTEATSADSGEGDTPFPGSPPLLKLSLQIAGGVWAVRAESKPFAFMEPAMAKPGRKVKKANHGKRPACSRPRKNRRQQVKT